jgi:radical SAM protein with 4Fe4S-binding SPASM domain
MTTDLLPAPTRRPLYLQPREKYLYLYVTNRCGLRCRHCYVGSDRLDEGGDMSLDRAVAVMEYFRETGAHDKLYILGGEPTMNPDLPRIVSAARERGYSVTISSNGDFDDDVMDRLPPELLASWNFSLESADPAVHRAIRGNPHNFQRVTHRIRDAVRRGHQVRLMCTVSHANAATTLDLIPFAAELGATTLSLHNLGLTGNAARFLRPLTPLEWLSFCERIEAHAVDPRIAVYYPPTFVRLSDQPKWFDRGYPGCPARSFDRPHVYPDGTVYACPLLMDGARHYVRFTDGGGLQLNPDPANEMNAYLAKDPTCTGCPATTTCGGGCPAYPAVQSYGPEYRCDRDITPLCILWTTYAGTARPAETVHAFR